MALRRGRHKGRNGISEEKKTIERKDVARIKKRKRTGDKGWANVMWREIYGG